MNYEPFLKRCAAKFPKEECLDVIVKKFESVFYNDDFSNNANACELFYITDRMSKAQFFRIKKYVKELYDWLFEQGLVTQEQTAYVSTLSMNDVISDEEIRHCYFASLDDALDFVSAVGRRCGLNSDDDLLMIKTIVILSWHGLDRAEIAEIRKSDLIAADKMVRSDRNEPIALEDKYFHILYRWATLDTHRGFPAGKRQEYEYSQYLMRAPKSERMDKDKITQAVKRFNVVAVERFGRRLSTRALRNNGIFARIFESEDFDSASITASIKRIAECDRHAAVWYKTMYERWKNIYYPEGSERN